MLLAVVTFRAHFRIVAETGLPNGLQYAVLTPTEFVRALEEGNVWGALIDSAVYTGGAACGAGCGRAARAICAGYND